MLRIAVRQKFGGNKLLKSHLMLMKGEPEILIKGHEQ
jgi:hypothetical protein